MTTQIKRGVRILQEEHRSDQDVEHRESKRDDYCLVGFRTRKMLVAVFAEIAVDLDLRWCERRKSTHALEEKIK
jgi:hypothetical protein